MSEDASGDEDPSEPGSDAGIGEEEHGPDMLGGGCSAGGPAPSGAALLLLLALFALRRRR
jgi:MYXO-CTERM domain-containing protein